MTATDFIKTLLSIDESKVLELEVDWQTFMGSVHDPHFLYHCRGLSPREVDALARRIALIEEARISGWGSTSQVSKLVNLLYEHHKEYDGYDALIDWLLKHRINEYVPFGRTVNLNVRSLAEYKKFQEDHAKHLIEMRNRDIAAHEAAVARKQEKYLAHKKVQEARAKAYYERINSSSTDTTRFYKRT